MINYTRLIILLMLIGFTVSCTLPPNISISECESMCSKQGRSVKIYQVGSAIPIFKPTPPTICECR